MRACSAYTSRKLTAAEQNYPAHVLELPAFVHALRTIYLLDGGAPRQADCWSDLDQQTDNQAITWLNTSQHRNKMDVRWLDEIEDIHFDVTHLQGSRNPTDPLSCLGFDRPAASTGDPDAESQQELFARLGRDASIAARRAMVRAGWATIRRAVHHARLLGADFELLLGTGPLRLQRPRTRVRQGLDSGVDGR